jgi:hypothetical protein
MMISLSSEMSLNILDGSTGIFGSQVEFLQRLKKTAMFKSMILFYGV